MAYVVLEGMQMYYEEAGRPDGPPLVLVHGFTSNGTSWEPQLAAFGAHYRLILPDLRGHGRSNNPAGFAGITHHQFAKDIIALCRLIGVERSAFCGESTGAMLQLWLACDAPDLMGAAILAGGTYYYSDDVRAKIQHSSPEAIDDDWRSYLQATHTALGPDHWRMVLESFQSLHTNSHSDDFPETADLRRITAPVLIIHGDRDHFFPTEVPVSLYGLLPNAELCILPNTGHVPPSEQPQWFNSIALDFLSRHYSPNTQTSETR